MSADVHPPVSPAKGETTSTDDYLEREIPLSADPLDLAAALVESPLGIDGGRPYVVYENAGTWFVALGAIATVTVSRKTVDARIGEMTHTVPWTDSPLPAVDSLLAAAPVTRWRAYGWAGFELAYIQAGLPELVRDDTLLHLMIPRTEVHVTAGRALIRSLSEVDLDIVESLLTGHQAPARQQPEPLDVTVTGADAYRESVRGAVAAIRDRRLQKVILSRVVPVPTPVDLVGTYLAGRRANNPTRSFLLDVDGTAAAGFSPEIVVSVDAERRVTTQPLAGTRALGGDTGENDRLRADLLADPKEIFEHAISVKVAYDELQPLCTPGSVNVTDFMSVKPRGSVQHLASSVTGTLSPNVGTWSAFAALFPAVTASGVPKSAAYHVIRDHEPAGRGLYSGAVVTVDADGSLDAALVLRTIFRREGRTWLQAGAGIVEQSTPDREFEETCEKLRSVSRHLVPGK